MSSNNSTLLSTPKHGSTAASKQGTVEWIKGQYVTSEGKPLLLYNNTMAMNEKIARNLQKRNNKSKSLHKKAKNNNTAKREKTKINNIKNEIYKKAAISQTMRNRGVEPYKPNSPAAIAAFRKDVNATAKAAAKVLANAKAVGNTRKKQQLKAHPNNLKLIAEAEARETTKSATNAAAITTPINININKQITITQLSKYTIDQLLHFLAEDHGIIIKKGSINKPQIVEKYYNALKQNALKNTK